MIISHVNVFDLEKNKSFECNYRNILFNPKVFIPSFFISIENNFPNKIKITLQNEKNGWD
jgi:hypothetical protein